MSFGRRFRILTALFVSVVAFSLAASSEGRIPIGAPVTLDATAGAAIVGKYIVTQNLTASTSADSRVIQVTGTGVEDVDVDLNGFTLTGGRGGSPVEAIRATNLRSLTIRNGTIKLSSPANGLWVENTRNVIIEDVKFGGASIAVRVQSLGTFALRRNVISGGSGGFWVDGSATASSVRGVIEDNIVENVSGRGIYIFANNAPVVIRGNVVDHSGFRGVEIVQGAGFLITENTIRNSGSQGIYADSPSGGKVVGNVVVSSGDDGIAFVGGGGCLILENTSNFNTKSGLNVQSNTNYVDGNILNSNGGAGLIFSGSIDNVFGRNMARSNSGTGIPSCASGSGGLLPPNYCNSGGSSNSSEGGNMMPGPPAS